MKLTKAKSSLLSCLLGIFLGGLLFISLLQAGSHPKSKFEWDATKQTGYFDLVITLDWNPDQSERDSTLNSVFHYFAQAVNDASEDKHKLRDLFVYVKTAKGELEKSSCDIYLKNSAGTANAVPNGFGGNGKRINMFMSTADGDPRDADYCGYTLAHEFGHYVYGLYDEYKQNTCDSNSPPSRPCDTDTTCDTIMHWQEDWQDFCTDKNHMGGEGRPETATNAQHRMHQASGWRTLVRDPKLDPQPKDYLTLPDRTQYSHLEYPANGNTVKQNGGDDELEIHYIDEASSQIVLIIDSSGSMDGDKINQAKAAAKQFVDLLQIGDKVAVVTFNSGVSVIWAMQEISGPPPQTNIKAAINSITAGGSTAMGDGMRTGLNELLNNAAPDSRRSAVLLGDGMHNSGIEHPNDVTPDYISNNIPVFTIGLGFGADEVLMKQIANATGGSYFYSPSAAELQGIYAAISQQTSSSDQLLQSFSDILTQGEMVEQQMAVDSSMTDFTSLLSWNQGDTMKFELVTPDGQVISPTNVNSFPNVSYAAEATYALYRVQNPAKGTWRIRSTAQVVSNTGEINCQIQGVTDVNLSLEISKTTINYPTPIGITASLRKNLYITDAIVTATITAPGGAKTVLTLLDNGQSPDFRPKDGFYSGVFTDYTQDGEYEIIITATNPNLTAVETDAGALEKGGTSTWRPIGENFLRSDKITVTVTGVVQDDHGNNPSEATSIQADKTPVLGKIEISGDLDFFKFDANENEIYSIRTSQLIAPLDTVVSLFDQNGSLIQNDDNGGGGNSSLIIWKAPEDGPFYVSVEGGGTTGNYQLAIGPAQPWEALVLTLQSGAGGTTNPAPGNYAFIPGEQVQVTGIPNANYVFVNWTGSISSTQNPVTIVMNASKTIKANFRFIYAPTASGVKVLNRSSSQAEYINILSWEANPANAGLDITKYKIYLINNGTPSLLAEAGADQSQYSHRKAGQASIQYAIVAVTRGGREGAPALVTVQ